VARGRKGWLITRTWRGLTGRTVHARITPRIGFSHAAVQRLVDRVRVAVARAAVDAEVSYRPDRVRVRRSRPGATLDASALRAAVRRVLSAAGGPRAVRAPIVPIAPKVTSAELAPRYPVILTVDRRHHRLRLFKKLRLARSYPVAVGRAGLETPAGLYAIHSKAVNPAWHVPDSPWAGALAGKVIPGGAPDNPIVARWLGVYDGVGVHGTTDRASIGHDASHGCIRMRIEDVEALYPQVPIGTPIYID
jgi:lipoprotein-anchoring transpeptidase ErfK/SrfK